MNPQKNVSELRAALTALNPYFRRAALFSVVATILVLAPSVYMLEVYGRVVNSRSHMTLAMLTLLVLSIYVVMEVLEWARGQLLYQASQAMDRQLTGRVFDAIFEASIKRVSAASAQAMSDLRTVREFLNNPFLVACMEAPVSLLFLLLVFLISPVLGATTIAAAVIQTLIAWLNQRATQPPLLEANRSAIAAQQYADGTLQNAQVIESMGMLPDIHRRWLDKQSQFLNLQAKASNAGGGYQAASKFVQNVTASALLGLGAWLFLRGTLNGGEAMMIIASILGGRVLAPMVQMVSQWQAVVNVREAWSRLEQMLAHVPPPVPAMELPPPTGAVSVEAVVAMAPNTQTPILKGLTWGLQPGEVLAVVGPSASGKTTLARLLVGVWPAASGKVRLDGVDVFAWNKHELGPHIGYLPQGVELFEGSLAENIARFDDVDAAQVEAAARAVGLHDWILSLPEQYATQVGRQGAGLSGGQRQRVGLARALYRKPAFVVLDEPNSSLDEVGDAALAQAIVTMKAGGTTFVVMTHRTSVLAVADKMLVLQDGQARAFGPRDEVLAALAKASTAAATTANPISPAALAV